MRVGVIAPSPVPFVFGGAERLWLGLVAAINASTAHQADLIKVPTREHTLPDLLRSYLAFASLDLSGFDCVISTKYPAWSITHDHHVVYLQHKLRGLYDAYPAPMPREVAQGPQSVVAFARWLAQQEGNVASLAECCQRYAALEAHLGPRDPALALPGPLARQLVHYFDRLTLAPARIRRYAAISQRVRARADYFPPGVSIAVVHHPTSLQNLRGGRYEYFLAPSRLDRPKRIDLAIEALKQSGVDRVLKIAGTGKDEARLRRLAAGDSRIEFLGHVPDDQLALLYRDALAVLFTPEDEDYGLIALEAQLCAKPVITTTDAGGVLELIQDGVCGQVVAPAAPAIAAALRRLDRDPGEAERLGHAGERRARAIGWEPVIETLLGKARRSRPSATAARAKVVAAVPYSCHPAHAGGTARVRNLYGALARNVDVHLVALTGADTVRESLALCPGLIEHRVPMSARHVREEAALRESIGFLQISDLVADRCLPFTPDYQEVLARQLIDADLLVLCQPFLWCEAAATARCPRVLDAQNVEYLLKQAMLPATPGAAQALAHLRALEERVASQVDLLVTCADGDADTFHSLYGVPRARLRVVGNGVNLDDSTFRLPSQRAQMLPRPNAVFLGSWHQPNVEALAVVEQLANSHPHVGFLVAGSVCLAPRDHYWPTNMLGLGVVDSARKRAIFNAGHLALNPMTSGSGTNLKMLDYMAAGLPVISTAVGARGLGVGDDEIVLADVDAFGTALDRVLAMPLADRDERARRARQRVEAAFDWRVLGDRFAAALGEHRLLPR
jgi:glycosyltransferase involved in cell wall biosynthesis